MRSSAAAGPALAMAMGIFVIVAAGTARAQDLDRQKGVRGRVIVADDLLKTPVRLAEKRERALKGPSIVRRPLGRPIGVIVEPPPALVVMLEGDGIRQENPEIPQIVVEGMRIKPGSLVVPRPMAVRVQNKQSTAISVVDETGVVLAKIEPGASGDAVLKAGERLLSIAEMPWATTAVRVLERGRPLPLKDTEIPLVDIPGGEYQLTFFFGSEPLRIQPIIVPERGLIFIDATVSDLKVVEVSIKDASMRVAVPPSLINKEAPEVAP